MQVDHRTELAAIKRFDQLVRYLRDRMGWPIEGEDFEEITFEYTPDELGIDPKNAAKIQEIKRLRPLSAAQPWGIFFVKFEPKRLPVIALRRILSQVALKKRASANSADRAAWAADDLLFVSNYGEGEERQISFAHFSSPADGRDLPTLKVLGWDNRDTALHLDAVARELSENLAWPKNDKDAETWRRQWRGAFTIGHREVTTKSQELSIRLADLARAIRDRIGTALAIETEGGPLTRLMKAFQVSLVHDMDAGGFADMYAQTIAYGLLSARIADPHKKTADDFAGHMRTNPFLRELMETFLKVGGRKGKAGGPGIDFDELGVGEVVALLDAANMEAVIRDFGDRNPQEDPVIHFYELFLHEYDAEKRLQRGVFYTPRPVVSYIVRSVHELLRTEFGLEDGLADTTTWGQMARRHEKLAIPDGVSPDDDFVQVLDPATGTGTFLVEVIDLIHRTLIAKWKKQGKYEKEIEALWNEYVRAHLLTRLHGYELLMAPYAIAHVKIGLKLYETGYHFSSEQRARVYLTNALEPPHDFSGTFDFAIPALAHEVQAVNTIKRDHHFTVVIGNPPYANYSANLGARARSLVDRYRQFAGKLIRERNQLQFERNLQDDYVKFISIGESEIQRGGVGILAYITNATMLASTSLRGMRERLVREFSILHELHLHGGANEISEDSYRDQNVFEIAQAVGIHVYLRRADIDKSTILFSHLWGSRAEKYSFLSSHSVSDTPWAAVVPDSENCAFVPHEGTKDLAMARLGDVFVQFGAGIKTNRDAVAIGYSPAELKEAVKSFSPELLARSDSSGLVKPILYRPFDQRVIFYHEDVVASRSLPTMQHVLAGPNIGLVASSTWTSPDRFSVGMSRTMVEMKSGTHDRGTTYFPLYRYDKILGASKTRAINLKSDFVARWRQLSAAPLIVEGKIDNTEVIGPDDLLFWIYGICHSNAYRERFRALLAQGFPIVLFPRQGALLSEVVRCGRELAAFHLMEAEQLENTVTTYTGPKSPVVSRVSWSDGTVWLDGGSGRKDQPGTIGFHGVPEAVWNFHIGGYQVCEKWLKDRRGRTLTEDDIAHYQKIVVALSETIRLMKEIDEIIERHGGWPGAFVPAGEVAADGTESAGRESTADVVVAAMPKRTAVPPRVAAGPVTTLLEAAEPVAADYKAHPRTADDIDREELICQIRQLFSSGGGRSREVAIRELATQLGYERVGPRIRGELENAIRTAVRRGILLSQGEDLHIDCRSIDDYERDFLKTQFLASLEGRTWTDREEAIRGFARWIGFRRTGQNIEDAARSLISGLIRDGRLESDGPNIRRT